MSPATLKSIAKATGFSVTTVSRALGGYDDVNAETRRIILEEAQQQGYRPNLQARLLQGQRSQTVGLILPTSGSRFTDPFFSEFVAGVGNRSATAGFDLLLSTHNPAHNENVVEIYRHMVTGRRVDGLVLARIRHDDSRIRYLQEARMPFVVFGRTNNNHNYAYIDVDGVAGQRTLTEHFIDLGHRRIAYIAPPKNLTFSQYRIEGFSAAMESRGIPVDEELVVAGTLTESSGWRRAQELLELPAPPTTIMTGNDVMAFGVMRAIQVQSKNSVIERLPTMDFNFSN